MDNVKASLYVLGIGIGVKKVLLLRSVFDVLTKGHVRIRGFYLEWTAVCKLKSLHTYTRPWW